MYGVDGNFQVNAGELGLNSVVHYTAALEQIQ